MPSPGNENDGRVALYDASYGRLSERLYAEIRRETWGEDLGQASWLTTRDLAEWLPLLRLSADSTFLDVACGSGGIACRIAERTGARVVGVDLHPAAIAAAGARPLAAGAAPRARFLVADGSRPLLFAPGEFDAVVCIDAVNHLADRAEVFREWRRVLRPGGRLLFTDPVVLTGAVDAREIAARSSVGTFLFTVEGVNQRLLEACGFGLLEVRNETAAVKAIADRWRSARERCATDLRRLEGDGTFEGQQEFLRIAALLAGEKRLSRMLYVTERIG